MVNYHGNQAEAALHSCQVILMMCCLGYYGAMTQIQYIWTILQPLAL